MLLDSRISAPQNLMEETRKYAKKLAGKPSFAMKMAKYAINFGYDLPLDNDARSLEIQYVCQCLGTENLKEGISAFFEK